MAMRRSVFVVGGAHTPFIGKFHPDFIWKGHPDFGKRQNPTLEQHLGRAALEALESARVAPARVERAFVGNFAGELFASQGHLGAALAGAHPDLALKPIARTEGACASGGLALAWGVDAVNAGNDVVLVAGAEVQTTVSAKDGADYLARAAHYATQRSIDPFTFPCLFARRARLYRERYGIGEEDIARVVVKAYANANRNPFAHMRTVKMSLAQAAAASEKNPKFLENALYRDFLKVSDCSQVSDGASAVVLVSEDGLRSLGSARDRAIEILACETGSAPLAGDPPDPTALTTTRTVAGRAYARAGVVADAMELAEVHDCFSITEIMMYEALGFAAPGKGALLAKEGATEVTGRIPVNTGGGLMGFGHPVGATGVKQAFEVYRQMKGAAGDYQVKRRPAHAIAANMGGDDRTAVVTVFRNQS